MNAVVLGLARQGAELCRFLHREGAYVTGCDRAAVDLATLTADGRRTHLRLRFGRQDAALLAECGLVALSAGVPTALDVVQAARRSRIPVVNDTMLTFAASRAPTTVVTGSNGKTTTTALAGALMQASHPERTVHVGGNIGRPLLTEARDFGPRDRLVWEASSFQLELFRTEWTRTPLRDACRIRTAVLTNVTPNHLDRHAGMLDYLQAKLNLLDLLNDDSTLILDADDPVCRRLLPAKRQRFTAVDPPLPQADACHELLADTEASLSRRAVCRIAVSRRHALPDGISLAGNRIRCNGKDVLSLHRFRLRGAHNRTNALLAVAAALADHRSTASLQHVLDTFTGIPHRLEEVPGPAGTTWINDSIATSPERAVAGIRSMRADDGPLVLLAGGRDKGLAWDGFAAEVRKRVQTLIVFGEAQAGIVRAMEGVGRRLNGMSIVKVDCFEAAVCEAGLRVRPGGTVLLSPGGTSFDSHADFAARGDHFRLLAGRLRNEAA